jgi:hypothetical protein
MAISFDLMENARPLEALRRPMMHDAAAAGLGRAW